MRIEELTNLGDRIDIQLLSQLEKEKNGQLEEEAVRTYKSSVYDFLESGDIEISMPTENGRMVLFQVGIAIKLLFYSKKGLFTCKALVKKRYKKDNSFVLSLDIISEPVKFQRREFYRIQCLIDIEYLHIDKTVASYRTTDVLCREIQKKQYDGNTLTALTLDISGGGMKFVTDEKLDAGSYILTEIRLTNEKFDQKFYLVTEIIESSRREKAFNKYENRAKFLFKDLRDREKIVHFVFEEERRLRRRQIG